MTCRYQVRSTPPLYIFLLLFLFGLAYFPMARMQAASNVPLVTVRAAGSKPLFNAQSARYLALNYTGEPDTVAALGSEAKPVSLASADFNADGAPDLVAGYSTANGGIVTLTCGNPDAFAPTDTTLYQKAMQGDVPATFLPAAVAYALPESPDLIVTGDFNRDANQDVLVAARGGNLYLLAGDGKGNLRKAQLMPLAGPVRAMAATGDGHVAVSVDGEDGPDLIILAPGAKGLTVSAKYPLAAHGDAVVWANLGGGVDVAVGAGSHIEIIYNALMANSQTETVNLPFTVEGLVAGDFIWDRDARTEIAALASDGTISILQHGTLDSRPLAPADIPGRRAAMTAKSRETIDPTSLGPWTIATKLPYAGVAPSGPVAPFAFTSPHMIASAAQDLMVFDAGRNQLNILDTSGAANSPIASLSFSGTPVAALALPQKINAGRDIVVLAAGRATPMLISANADPTVTVNTTADTDGQNACGTNSTVTATNVTGTISLRAAMCAVSNSPAGTYTVSVPAGTYQLSCCFFGGNQSSTSSGELQAGFLAGTNISIVGSGASSTIIEQTDGKDRVIEQDPNTVGLNLSISNVTLTGGTANPNSGQDGGYGGGAVLAGSGATAGNFSLTDAVVTSNTAGTGNDTGEGASGGALNFGSAGTFTITSSTLSDNTSYYGPNVSGGTGGAITVSMNASAGSMTITNSVFTGNTAEGQEGGAIDASSVAPGSPVTISGSTFTGNRGLGDYNGTSNGGAIAAAGSLTVSNSRIVGNSVAGSAAANGSGVYMQGSESSDDATLVNNWWGCNGGPGASGCDTAVLSTSADGATLTTNPWLVLSISADPTQVQTGNTSTLTADLTHNSSGTGGLSVPTGTPVTFGGTLDSSVNPGSTTLTSGTATSTYTAGSTGGAGSGTATVDNQTASVTIDVVGGTSTSAAVDDASTGNAWSGTETAGASAYATASVIPSGSGPTPTGSVTYTFYSGSTCTSTTVGTSTVTLSGGSVPRSTTVGPLGASTYSLSATYTGDSYHAGSSSTCSSFTVNKAQPATSVGSSPNPSTPGQSVTLTATVSGGYAPSGTVGFTSNSVAITNCTAVTLSSGQAQCMTSSLATGTDAIVATYSGDGNNSSSSGTLSGGQQVATCKNPNPNPNPNPQSFANPGDFNGDCKSDILWENSSTGQLYEWYMNGTTSAYQETPGGAPSPWTIAGEGDFNGDGMADILWRDTTTGEVYVWLTTGATTTIQTSLGVVSTAWSIVGVGDFDGDGKADILWWNSSTGQVYIWFMNGTTITSQLTPGSASSPLSIVGVGDFNGDGKADIVLQNSSTGQVYIWLMNGATVTSQVTPGSASSPWSIVGVGDFDGDGKSDLLWWNSSTGQTYIWFMNGGTTTSQQSPGSAASPWNIAGVGDFDGDGKADILWRNSSTGQVYVWLMNGPTTTTQQTPGGAASPWEIFPLAP